MFRRERRRAPRRPAAARKENARSRRTRCSAPPARVARCSRRRRSSGAVSRACCKRGRGALFVVGIDQKRLSHLRRRAGKLAQQQDSVLLLLAGDVFLRDQVHAVAQRRHPAGVRLVVQGHQLRARDSPPDVDHRRPVRGAELSVDLAHQFVHLAPQRLVGEDLLARRHRHLNQHHFLAQFRRRFQQPAVGAQPIGNALGIVQAVHPQQDPPPAVAPLQVGDVIERLALAQQPGELVGRDSDRQRGHAHRPAAYIEPVDGALAARDAQQRSAKVLQVRVGLKCQQVRPQQAVQQFGALRNDAEYLRGRKRNVQEETDRGVGQSLPQAAWGATSTDSRAPRSGRLPGSCGPPHRGTARWPPHRRPSPWGRTPGAKENSETAATGFDWRSPRRNPAPSPAAGPPRSGDLRRPTSR